MIRLATFPGRRGEDDGTLIPSSGRIQPGFHVRPSTTGRKDPSSTTRVTGHTCGAIGPRSGRLSSWEITPEIVPFDASMRSSSLLFLTALLWPVAALRANVTPAPLFKDHAVLQRDKPLPIWGEADPGEMITVALAGQVLRTKAGSDGRWIVYLDPLPANALGIDLIITGKNEIVARNVMVGEVWLCSGQSNMEWPLAKSRDAAQEIAAAQFPLIRHIKIKNTTSERPAAVVETSGWETATPATAGAFTAVGYFFARDLQQKLGIPVGIVNCSWSGTPVEAWMSPAALTAQPGFAINLARWNGTVAEYPIRKAAFDRQLPAWIQAEAASRVTRKNQHALWLQQNPRPRAPRGFPGDPWAPAGLFNGMVHPLLPYALRGVLWYQGENNAERAGEYHALFSALITAWRAHFGQGDFPFYWVNLANFGSPGDSTGTNYAFLREAQTKTLALPNTGQAIAIDLGNRDDIHPTNKQDVGRRLALLAKARDYDITVDDTGPTFLDAVRVGSDLRVQFAHASGGLIAYNKPVQSLEIAGEDRIFRPANARIVGDTLLVSSPAVKAPVAVRYAWKNAPEANLYNGAGLPAVPFRSDNW